MIDLDGRDYKSQNPCETPQRTHSRKNWLGWCTRRGVNWGTCIGGGKLK